jgi:hypothetical protein
LSTELAGKVSLDGVPVDAPEAECNPIVRRNHGGGPHFAQRGKLRLITRDHIDGRTLALKAFDKQVAQIVDDLGGSASLSAIELALVEAYAGATLVVNHMTARMLDGEQISLTKYSAACGALVRIATRLGVKRRGPQRQTLDLGSYLDGRADKQDESGSDSRDDAP